MIILLKTSIAADFVLPQISNKIESWTIKGKNFGIIFLIFLKKNHFFLFFHQATPSLVSRFSSSALQQDLLGASSTLRLLAFGGESCPTPATIARWRGAGNRTEFINLYGITEVSSWASCFKIPEKWIEERLDHQWVPSDIVGVVCSFYMTAKKSYECLSVCKRPGYRQLKVLSERYIVIMLAYISISLKTKNIWSFVMSIGWFSIQPGWP